MIHALKTYGALPYSVVWFPQASDATQVRRLRTMVTVVRQGSAGFLGQVQERVVQSAPFCTAGADLTQPEAQLLAAMHTTSRRQIRRGLELEYGFAVAAPAALPAARRLIDDFQQRKFGRPVSAENWRVIAAQGCLAEVTYHGEVIAAHSYLLDGTRRVRLLHACTVPRPAGATEAYIGRLSRVLHWRSMQHFKALGVRLYDAGGLFDDPNHPAYGIDRYKLELGLRKFYEYHAVLSPYATVRYGLRTLRRRP